MQNYRGHNMSTFCTAAPSQTKTSRDKSVSLKEENLGQRSSDLTTPFSACTNAISMLMALWPVPVQTSVV
jgi:hypothetical protein